MKFLVVIDFFPSIFSMKFRGRDDTIACRATYRVKDDEAESSQIQVERVVSTDLHRKWLAGRCSSTHSIAPVG